MNQGGSAPGPLNVIVVEDHDDLREATVQALCAMGHSAQGADCAEALDDELSRFSADVLLIDIGLPGEDGVSLARRIRAADPDIGIILLTARQRLDDKLQGYGAGADLYLVKPVFPDELSAALQSLARRLKPQPLAEQCWLGSELLELRRGARHVRISETECALLQAFLRDPDRRLSLAVWKESATDRGQELHKSVLEVQMVRLRHKLAQVGVPAPHIKSVRGVGYQLCVALKEVPRGLQGASGAG